MTGGPFMEGRITIAHKKPARHRHGQREAAGVVSLLIAALALGLSLIARKLASRISVMPRDGKPQTKQEGRSTAPASAT